MAFLFPAGAPLPEAPPCIRQRRFPRTGGNRHGWPLRVRAPHRALGPAGDEAGCIYFPLLTREHAGLPEEIESDLSRIIVEIRGVAAAHPLAPSADQAGP